MNLAVFKKTRRAPRVGDVFVMQPPDGQFLFGRVISLDANPLGVGGAVLIYIYRTRSHTKQPVAELLPGEFLVPPMMTNKLPWTRGYFEFVENRALAGVDLLPQHCSCGDSRGWYFDEGGNQLLPGPVEPVGAWGLPKASERSTTIFRWPSASRWLRMTEAPRRLPVVIGATRPR